MLKQYERAEKLSSSAGIATGSAFRILKERKFTNVVQASQKKRRGKP
jgi:hypothetical protein